jgi:tRNA(Leu) C34 or U34 (ribose-2'-O)-methylase TrmL
VPVFPAVLVLGGERSGVSSEATEAANAAVAIPRPGMANSLNVATAAAILLYWLTIRFEGTEILLLQAPSIPSPGGPVTDAPKPELAVRNWFHGLAYI